MPRVDLDELEIELAEIPAWARDGLCHEYPEIEWFPGRNESAAPAQAICARCLVRQECRDYAIAERIEHGVWGGLTAHDRDLASGRRSPRAARPSCPRCSGALPPGRVGLCRVCAEAA